MRLALKPGLLPVWRDDDTLQIGIDPRRAVAVCGVGRAAVLVSLLDGSRDHEAIIAAARAHGITAETVDRLITLLAAAGVLDEFPAGLLRTVPDGLRSRLAPELATTSLAHGDGDGGARALARRSGSYVAYLRSRKGRLGHRDAAGRGRHRPRIVPGLGHGVRR